MSTISTEQAKDLRNAFKCWQHDYDPVEDKEQYDMFGLGVVAMDELLALRKEREKAEPVAWVPKSQIDLLKKFRMVEADMSSMQRFDETPLYTAPPAPVVPEGWKLVPLEPTQEMIDAHVEGVQSGGIQKGYRAMLDAAPAPVDAGWIACSERMPVEKDIVLVVDDGYFVCEAQYREGDFFSAVRGNNEFFETTCRDVEFWQPLPEPPCK
ncbi:DUF551 domain-containing protein [Cronobacter malonaticus]|uniref:DUF551 domain-containing protein n=1 Tax=Cronobacter malonaticus TaxID=413503 RepID=UPI000CFB5201|nr:DUF551 domain-containing protein [Cronobacter malonaticus]